MNKRSEAQAKYDKLNTVQILLKLNKKTDKDILDNVKFTNKQGSIKELIRKGLKENENS